MCNSSSLMQPQLALLERLIVQMQRKELSFADGFTIYPRSLCLNKIYILTYLPIFPSCAHVAYGHKIYDLTKVEQLLGANCTNLKILQILESHKFHKPHKSHISDMSCKSHKSNKSHTNLASLPNLTNLTQVSQI